MKNKFPADFESLEDLKEWIAKNHPGKIERAFDKVQFGNPIVAKGLAEGLTLEEIIVELDRENKRLQDLYFRLVERQGPAPLFFRYFED
jgi:hypothetical protein